MAPMNRDEKFLVRPLYLQVRDAVLDRIRSGKLRSGGLLPSEVDLHRELGVSEENRFCRAPVQIRKNFERDEVDLGLERRCATEWDAEIFGQDRQVLRRKRVAPGRERVERAAVAEKHPRLAFLHDELAAPLDVRGAGFGPAMNDLLSAVVKELND